MASQAFLDATRDGHYATPAAWTALADAWEASGISAEVSEQWIDAGIQNPNIAAQAIANGVTPADAQRIGPWIASLPGLPAMANALLAVAVMRGVAATGVRLPAEDRVLLLSTCLQEFGRLGIDVGET